MWCIQKSHPMAQRIRVSNSLSFGVRWCFFDVSNAFCVVYVNQNLNAYLIFFVIKMKASDFRFWGNCNCLPLSLIKSPRLGEKVHIPAITLRRILLFSFQPFHASVNITIPFEDFHQLLCFSCWTIHFST